MKSVAIMFTELLLASLQADFSNTIEGLTVISQRARQPPEG